MNPKPGLARRVATPAALALVAAVTVGAHPAAAQYGRSSQYWNGRPYSYEGDPDYSYRRNPQYRHESKREPAGQSRNVEGAPLLAVVALGEQSVTIYNAHGKMLQSPVSTGATELETPAGIYSVLQKEEFHQSNVYEDGNMPFMERITWTGIALHGGVLPGYPASHGCVRMPEQFAERLFSLTDIGMRVVVVPHDIAPAEISHPGLFRPAPLLGSAPGRMATAARGSDLLPGIPGQLEMLKAKVAAKSAQADAATKRAVAARQVATNKAADAAKAVKNMGAAEGGKAKAAEALKAAERAIDTASSPEGMRSPSVRQAELAKERTAAKLAEAQTRLEAVKEKAEIKDKAEVKLAETRARLETARENAATKLAEAQAQLEATKSQAQARADEAERAEDEAKSAEAARDVAAEASADASRKTSPVSVFISRKAQRLYVRQGYVPVFEGPVTIRDAERPIGSYVFTALGYHNNAEVRWSVVSMYKANRDVEPAAQGQKRNSENSSAEADVAGAKAALDRITIPPDVVERFSEVVLPGASLIISDEGASIETGKDTDFVVLMSGEPQGGIKTRHREQPRYRREDNYYSGSGSFFSFFN
jgi:hypothetical protein